MLNLKKMTSLFAKPKTAQMTYIIWDKDDNPLTAAVEKPSADYFKTHILPNLKPLEENDYIEGFSAILHSLARWSYVLYDNKLYWLTEWDPGLIVLEFSDQELIRFTALRSPIPNFGKRVPLDIDNEEDYDENAENYQYNLVFDAWDAQFDEKTRKWNGFEAATDEDLQLFRSHLDYVDKLGDVAQDRFEDDFKNYYKNGMEKIEALAGIGVVVGK